MNAISTVAADRLSMLAAHLAALHSGASAFVRSVREPCDLVLAWALVARLGLVVVAVLSTSQLSIYSLGTLAVVRLSVALSTARAKYSGRPS